jgi:hypothetical protein
METSSLPPPPPLMMEGGGSPGRGLPGPDIDDQQLQIPIPIPRPPDPNYRTHQKRTSYTMMKQSYEDGSNNGVVADI